MNDLLCTDPGAAWEEYAKSLDARTNQDIRGSHNPLSARTRDIYYQLQLLTGSDENAVERGEARREDLLALQVEPPFEHGRIDPPEVGVELR
jgi:hypothetical protein